MLFRSRPDTVFRITQYTRGGDEESALLRLFRGGFRAVTGLVAKRGPDAFRVQTATSTIVIRCIVRCTPRRVRNCDSCPPRLAPKPVPLTCRSTSTESTAEMRI